MSALAKIFQRRHLLLRDLQTTNAANVIATKLMSKGVATRAACFFGIDAHLDLHRVAPGSRLPFGSSDPLLRGIGRDLTPSNVPEADVESSENLEREHINGGNPDTQPMQFDPVPTNGNSNLEGGQ
jgi:hypothetical protein